MATLETSPSLTVQAIRHPSEPSTLVVMVSGTILRSNGHWLGEAVDEFLSGEPAARVICDVSGVRRADAAVVDALCRMKLAARRHGCRLEVRDPAMALQELLSLTGLTSVIPAGPTLPVEVGRQPE